DLLHDAVMARAQCGMATDQRDVVGESLLILAREFPGDTKVLYITTRYYSELANRTAQDLIQKAPSSPEAETLIAEAFQAQGKLDDATAQFPLCLKCLGNEGLRFGRRRSLLYQVLGCAISQLGVIAGSYVENLGIPGELARQNEERLADYIALIRSHPALRPCHDGVMQKI